MTQRNWSRLTLQSSVSLSYQHIHQPLTSWVCLDCLHTMLGVCITRSSRGASFPSQHHRFYNWSISRKNYSTDVEYCPIRSVLVANRGECWIYACEEVWGFHIYIFLSNETFFVFSLKIQGNNWQDEQVNSLTGLLCLIKQRTRVHGMVLS